MTKKNSFRYFIGYINESNAFPVPLCIKRSQMKKYIIINAWIF